MRGCRCGATNVKLCKTAVSKTSCWPLLARGVRTSAKGWCGLGSVSVGPVLSHVPMWSLAGSVGMFRARSFSRQASRVVSHGHTGQLSSRPLSSTGKTADQIQGVVGMDALQVRPTAA